ncbi:tRNA (adenosine(37)-N6)-dimethylallyltransferase MiaA [Georgenia sp. TF02-10]|uniref:tRNA (adenosine(37)-N6)-dimethylallyltransferase MiaA n=1 Tax=Georgenia sp. TF02-10 TaxID=2917725 RepID=UPI001FA72BC1|nr:tRNA (adenosine(37)-N6)-dimethylallyltransferase MiaA [Georgenia sp. TF02-10]UNX55952.1 tRNA (adenosine(37)-N6)-dimethylallyltransferase MiaA [Georgenia sp. TF02-10]
MAAVEEPPLIAIVGVTASGKSDLALDLAEALGGPGAVEIVNADAMQLYRGMDIGTAKVPADQRRGVAHHQLDVLHVRQEASVAAYQAHARADIAAIRARGRLPVLVGGSGLYVRAVLDQLEFPGTDPAVRAGLEVRAAEEGPDALHVALAELDPPAAAAIDPRNTRRLVRALEVITLTGRPFSARLPEHVYALPAVQLAVDVPRLDLDGRIAARAAWMMAGGLLEETARLLDEGLAESPTAARAVGYAQAMDVLAGRSTPAEAVDAVALATRQLARRQEKWFRRDPRIRWLPRGDPDTVLAAALRTLGR